MGVVLGIIFHFLGGFASGSFYAPYKKVKGWSWETFWLVGGLFSWLFVPFIAAWLTIPDFWNIIQSADGNTVWYSYIFGILWGIGGFTYGLGVRYLGVSLGSTIILGLCMIFGAILPSIYYNFNPSTGKDSFTDIATNSWGQVVLLGMAVCVIGMIICGKAGVLKEKQIGATADESHGKASDSTEFKFGLGLAVSIVSGILSACFNFGLEAGKPMADAANTAWKIANPEAGHEFLFQNNVTYIVVLWGGLTSNAIGCFILAGKNKSFGEYFKTNVPRLKNIIFCAIAGTMWYLQFFFYGMGESKMGNGASSWILHMAFIILIANGVGLLLGEWKGVDKKAKNALLLGIAVIILSVIIVGIGNSLK